MHNAGYQAGHHDTCLPGTRESVLDEIMQWAKDPQDRHVFWLNGLAGTGKSTIAQTFSGMVSDTGILGASFFCSRDYLNRKELKNIFPTLAYQLACRYPAFRSRIIQVIKRDPSVAQNSLISQFKDLIIDPLSSTNTSCVIIIDALDECIDDQPASAILSVLGRLVKKLPFVKFFITGRPEPRIRSGFRLPLLEPLTQVFLLHEVKLTDVDEDIRLYLQEKLTAVAKRRSDFDISDPWPCDTDLVALTRKAAGLFIFASTLTRFIESEHHEPNERLQLIVSSSGSTVHEGRAGIDPLYTQVLMLAFTGVKEEDPIFANLRRVLGAVVLAFNPLSREQIAKVLGTKPSLITTTLRHLHSVLLVPREGSKEIRIFHKSFPDFLQDPDRCSDPRFFVDSPVHHGDIALDCLGLLKKLKSNPCDLPDFVMNRDVANVPELLDNKVGIATRYACGYWAMHVRLSPTTDDYAIRLIPSATEFFKKNAIPWIEVMSFEKRLESVIHSIYNLFDWLGMVCELYYSQYGGLAHLFFKQVSVSVSALRSLAEDCLRFTMHFFHPIQQSASHVYHSALPLSPRTSMFHSKTLKDKTKIRVFHGQADAWGVTVRTIPTSSKNITCMEAFSNKIAAACDDNTVGIYDSITGVLKLSMSLADPVKVIRGSPDGLILFCAHKTPSITVWDMQTGGLVHTFHLGGSAQDIAVSLEGRYLASRSADTPVEVWEVSGEMGGAAIWTGSSATSFCWLDPEALLAVSTGASVDIHDILGGTTLRSLTVPYPVQHMVYSQKFNRLAIKASSETQSTVTIVDPQIHTPTASHWVHENFPFSCFTFSQTTEELVCGMETQGLQLFDISTRHFKHLEHPDTMTSVSSLKNGTVVANFVSSGIQLLSLEGEQTLPQQPTISVLTVRAFDGGRIIAIFPTTRDQIILLEPTTMSQLLTIPVRDTPSTPSDDAIILCVSHKNHVAVYSFEREGTHFLEFWGFHEKVPRWTIPVEAAVKTCRISPGAVRLLTLHAAIGSEVRVRLWNAKDGKLEAQLDEKSSALDIVSISDTNFSVSSESHIALYSFEFNRLRLRGRSTHLRTPIPTKSGRDLDIDDAHEWVVSDSKKICWIPPGYIRPTGLSYCWAGSSLVMVGQDGELRKLTFSS